MVFLCQKYLEDLKAEEAGDILNLKVIIADDDAGMRLVLKKLISRIEGFELAGEANNGFEAVELTERVKPHITFLDVEMPVMTGIECAKKIADINPRTFIIFVTAHEEYMPEAFELYAFDYLVKPFKIERVEQTLQRIKALAREPELGAITKIIKHNKGLDKLVLKSKEGISFVDMEAIILIQREDRSTVVYTSAERYVTSEGLSELEERLDSSLFFRCHKSYIINLSCIQKIYPYGRWTYVVKLKGQDIDALLTHDRYEELQKLFGTKD